MAVPKKKTSKAKGRSRRGSIWVLERPAAGSVVPTASHAKVPTRRARTAGGTRAARP